MTTETKGTPECVDAHVSALVAGTNGLAYKHLIGRLAEYPIPDIRLPRSNGALLLDVGCSWGRWSIAAARRGYLPVGIDPKLESVQAAKRVASQLGLRAIFVVADARALPFRAETIDVVYSYSVLQHFSTPDVGIALSEIERVLKPGGTSLIQMAAAFGVRCLYHQVRRGFREAFGFEVRYRRIRRLREMFTRHIGPCRLSVDCFFGLGIQESDIGMMPPLLRLVFRASALLRRASVPLPWLLYLADSVYVENTKAAPPPGIRDTNPAPAKLTTALLTTQPPGPTDPVRRSDTSSRNASDSSPSSASCSGIPLHWSCVRRAHASCPVD